MKKIAILGSTGSIGTQTIEVVLANDDMKVVALAAAGNRLDLLEEQVRRLRPSVVGVYYEAQYLELKQRLKDLDCRIVSGMQGLLEIVALETVDVVVTAFVGMMGIRPTIEAIKSGKDIALANKETLVTAGHIIMPLVKQYGVALLPVDSEHSAIFQSLNGERSNPIEKILLTASGGPFRTYTKEQMKQIRLEDALKHPNWAMGPKITIDSSTMVNKGLEVMEAKWLFGVSGDRIEVVIQPQSIIHSMVQFEDGAVIAQLGTPDMKLPIQYALTYPERRAMCGKRLDFALLKQITFEAPDLERFPALAMAYEADRKGGNAPTVFNAANEMAVAMFLKRRISYPQIVEVIENSMQTIAWNPAKTLADVLDTEQEVIALIKGKYDF